MGLKWVSRMPQLPGDQQFRMRVKIGLGVIALLLVIILVFGHGDGKPPDQAERDRALQKLIDPEQTRQRNERARKF